MVFHVNNLQNKDMVRINIPNTHKRGVHMARS